MLIVEPDCSRRIDLPGAGPCPRPVDIDDNRTPLAHLVSLRVYSFAGGVAIDGEAEGDEVFITVMDGAARIVVTEADGQAHDFALGTDRGDRIVYMPPHAAYRLTAVRDCDIAYARCHPRSSTPGAQGFAEGQVADHATGMTIALAALAPGGSIALGRGERFVHVRAKPGGVIRVGGASLGDWTSAVMNGDDAAIAVAEGAPGEILTIRAVAD